MSENLRKIPFIRILLPFMTGILIQSFFKEPGYQLPWFVIIILLFVLILFRLEKKIIKRQHSQLFGLLTSIILIASGIELYNKYGYNNNKQVLPERKKYYTAFLTDYPAKTKNSFKVIVQLEAKIENEKTIKCSDKVLLYFSGQTIKQKLEAGTRITFYSQLFEITNNGNPGEFNFKKYYSTRKIFYKSYLDNISWEISEKKHKKSILISAKKIRHYIQNKYKEYGIIGEEFSLLSALSLGNRIDLSTETRDNFAAAGAMHILAVSGLHVGIIYYMLFSIMRLFPHLKRGKIVFRLLNIIILWTFAFLSGLSDSVIRATLMLSFHIISQIISREHNIYNTISLTAFIMLFINPLSLFAPGFQLSFIAVAGIIYFYPKIYESIKIKRPLLQWIWKMCSVSIAAQLVTFPLSLYYFNFFPNFFLLTNLIALPIATIIIYTSIFFMLLSGLDFMAKIVSFILNTLLSLLNSITAFIAELPYSVSGDIYFSIIEIVLIYLLIICITICVINKNNKYVFLLISCFIFIQGFYILNEYKANKTIKIIVWNCNNSNLQIISGKKNYLISDSFQDVNYTDIYSMVRKFNFAASLEPPDTINIKDIYSMSLRNNKSGVFMKNGFGMLAGKKFLLIDNNFNMPDTISFHPSVDYVFIFEDNNINIKELVSYFNPELIVLGRKIPSFLEKKFTILAGIPETKFYSVRKKGAFILKLKSFN